MKVNIGDYPDGDPDDRVIEVKLDPWDTWSLDSTLALIILPALKEFRKGINGYPGSFTDLVGGNEDWQPQLSFDFYKESAEDYKDAGFDAWKRTVDKMIWSFEQIVDDDRWEKYYTVVEGVKRDGATIKDMIDSFKDDSTDSNSYYEVRPVQDYAGRERHEEKIREGLMLFGKYFQHLWT